MDDGQNLANEIRQIDEAVKSTLNIPLSVQQQLWIDYNALGGLITDNMDDKALRKMTIGEFANGIGVSRETLRMWRLSIPNFWLQVNERRKELAPQARLQKMHDVWYTSALMKGKDGYRDRMLWLANFDPNFRMPAQKIEGESGNSLADLFSRAKKSTQAIEGEVVQTDDQKADV